MTANHARIGVPTAVLGVLATALAAAPAAAAAVPASERWPAASDTGALQRLNHATRPVSTMRAVPMNAAPASYVVQPGDTVAAISARHGLSTVDVLSWNGLGWRTVIYPGQTLNLTAPVATAATTAAPTPTAAPASAAAHTVVAGDTLFAIAQRYGTSVDVLYAANGLEPSSIIYPGQSIAIAAAVASSPVTAEPIAALNAPQAENAALIIRIGRELGVSDRGIAIALATSMVESWLRNLDWGDRDSKGLFQQRPSTGWGTGEQIGDRQYAIRAFFLGASDANGKTTRGLLDIPGWESMAFTDAAQAVQISAHPERYGTWEDAAYQWLALYG